MKNLIIKRYGIVLILLVSFLIGSSFFLFDDKNTATVPMLGHGDGIIAYVSDEDLAITSPIVIEGYVSDIGLSKWNTTEEKPPNNINPNETLYHDVTIHVDKVLKGVLNTDSAVVRLYEEVVNDGKTIKGMLPEGKPKYSSNEKVIIFLDYDDSSYNQTNSKDYYITRGMYQGKWTIIDDKVSNSVDSKAKDELLNIISIHKNDYRPHDIPIKDPSIER
jgi:hypothetical protein